VDFRDFEEEFQAGLAEGRGQWAILDSLQDPRNYGAVLRSAAAFGVKAVIVGRKDQSPLTGVVAQASAGQSFRVKSVSANNLGQIVKIARDAGAHVLALDGSGKSLRDWFAAKPQGAIVWVLGSEGEGVRSKLLENATQVLRLPMAAGVESLNASVAASLAFYEGSSLAGEGIV